MKKIFVAVLSALFGIVNTPAAEWQVRTACAGDIKVVCQQPGDWKFELHVDSIDGKEILTVGLTSDSLRLPPRFEVIISVPQLDIHHLWRPGDMDRCQLRPDWMGYYSSNLAFDMPLYAFINSNNGNRLTVAASEPLRNVDAQFGLVEEGSTLLGKLSYFNGPQTPMTRYETKIMLDPRAVMWSEAVKEGAEWMTAEAALEPVAAHEEAFAPLYSTWYNFHQNVTADRIERECLEASRMGMKTIILDDGWQTDDNNRGYAFCGDWQVSHNRFPDFAAHVKRVQDMGMKYMVWYSVPYVGKKSRNYERFKGKYLSESAEVGVLDPRFPEVREFLCSTYENAMKEYGLDGFKLDFIDSFRFDNADPAEADNYAGRDIKSLPAAIDVLMKEIYRRLSAIRPDVLIEFRQRYIGPAMRQYGNMFRAGDCPADLQGNRQRIANLRLTSGESAVHSDMLEWNLAETPENAARHILSALFGVVQYSLMLGELPENHTKVIRHWLDFSQKHRETLLKSEFRPYHPEKCYPVIEAESDDELIVAVYDDMSVPEMKTYGKRTYIINASGAPSLVLDMPAVPRRVVAYDVYGHEAAAPEIVKGVQRVAVPLSGYLQIEY